MSTPTSDAAACAPVRAAVEALRRAEYTLVAAVAELAATDVAEVSGYRSPRRLVEDLCRVDAAAAQRLLAHGAALVPSPSFSGEPREPALPATAAAHAAGDIGAEHVRVVSRAMEAIRRVPDLAPDVVAAAEATLARHATQLSPRGTERAAARLLAHLDPDGVAPLDPPEPEDELRAVRRRRDGALAFSGVIHGAADVELWEEVFDALSGPAGPDDRRPLAARRAETLLDLVAQAASPGGLGAADEPPAPGAPDGPETQDEPAEAAAPSGVRPSTTAIGRALLAITIDEQRLRLGVGHGLLDSDAPVSAAEARRLACDAAVIPVVLGSRSQPLDVGRLAYTVPEALRRALHVRDRGCTFPGCTRRPRRCHAHHVRHWVDGGDTAPENVTLLCRYHHHLVHHDDWAVEIRAGRPWFVPPAWIDPSRTPRPGGPHPPG